ncbi:TPA: hypothetical protein DIU27_00730 [Candidatus Collierbacteria bacterium]|uniref:Uncharacterized protein n=1 Tax=Candidatus Collierbacteria bacterium GW2011_GWB2_44_22 TaxID=1618387 RepID=A0A0G1HZP9_9BACT|nr:MAG: hypothetical protein UW31_C0005G0022 [Candidatus Collierbacteria bacterium GW2011_GWA2_44_13]KKT52470.1 MAG: hypothetical protein UW44_C0001G0022 [Candidatus Collierbacteria bacterium GW2011_GWB2_44_22]KKT62693.1 MAG: hypothetical protein UW56_C0004G0006 [Candidatus Collierbacteria bacterium GW2011_GWD1_44_27]KKT65541.1 MAG: hypothetical protein UW58_C0027G0023 [Candidatus Collierbacteria bacterium GW2011_GWC2_44_30]KKT69173.1 MAG: hypothetical protein UW64_C0003G0023 [Microgenomates gr
MGKLFEITNYIINKGKELASLTFPNEEFVLDYVAIFCRDGEEISSLTQEIEQLGDEVEETSTGKTYKLRNPLNTAVGNLYLIKLRHPDHTRPQRGEPDFRVSDYFHFKSRYSKTPGITLIERDDYEMLELSHPKYDVLVYFPNKPLGVELGIGV